MENHPTPSFSPVPAYAPDQKRFAHIAKDAVKLSARQLIAQLGFQETDDPSLRGKAIGFMEMGHENIEAGKDRERLRREFHFMNLRYKIWYGVRADPARPPTRYCVAATLGAYNILRLLVND